MKTSYTPARLAVLGGLALAASLLQAQTPSLAPVVVTATRTATPITDQLSEITLISRQDIERSGAQSLVQLLSFSPGLQVSPESVRGATASVFIRGSNNQHALVLVDGQRVSSATVGATAIAHLPLEQIDRVEVLRGSASSLYGADALGGVIQVFTRQGERAPAPELALTLGSYGTRAASASYGGKVDGSRFRISVGRELSSGFNDIRAAKAELEAKGVVFYSDVNVVDEGPLAGWRWCYFSDPDGLALELVEVAYYLKEEREAAISSYLDTRPALENC